MPFNYNASIVSGSSTRYKFFSSTGYYVNTLTGCAASTTTSTTVTISFIVVVSGVSLTVAQSASFQSDFIAAVAIILGVVPSRISITSVVASSRRHLLAGTTVNYAVTTSPDLSNTITSTLASSGGAITSALASGYTGVTVANAAPLAPTFAPTMEPAQPSPAPAGGASNPLSAASCFAGSEQVTLENGHTKAMADVQVGDRVLTVNAKGHQVFSDVVYLPHGRNEEQAIFAQISTESGRDLKMTLNHILPAGACALSTLPLVAARRVVMGDCIQTVDGREQVVSVGQVEGKGIYTIIAMEELIVVSGIVVTPYGGINPTLANM